MIPQAVSSLGAQVSSVSGSTPSLHWHRGGRWPRPGRRRHRGYGEIAQPSGPSSPIRETVRDDSRAAAAASSSSGSLARLLTVSPSSTLIRRTPWVLRPIGRVSATRVRMRMPRSGGEHDLVGVGYLGHGDDRSVAVAGLDVDQALAAAVLGAVFRQHGALAIAVAADRQQAGRVVAAVGDHHADDLVSLLEADPLDAVGGPAHGTDVGLVEPDRHAGAGAEDDLVAGLDPGHADELVSLVEPQGDDPSAQRAAEGRQLGLLHGPAAGDHHQALVLAELTDRNQPRDLLPLGELKQVDDGPAAGGPGRHGQVINLDPVDLAVIGEEQDIVVRQRNEHVLEEVALAGVGRRDPPAAPPLGAIG